MLQAIKKNLLRQVLLAALSALLLTAMSAPAFAAPRSPQFGPPEFYKMGPGPLRVIAKDFNKDRVRDVVTANRFGAGEDDITIRLGKGDGTLGEPQSYFTGTSTFTIASGDYDGDGNRDVVVGDPDAANDPDIDQISILDGNGDGAFSETPRTFPSGGQFPSALDDEDYDRDGDIDIVVAHQGQVDPNTGRPVAGTGSVTVLQNDGDGNFTVATTLPGLNVASSVESTDFDEDRDMDLVVTQAGSDEATIFFGQAGTLAFTEGPSLRTGDNPADVAVARDFNSDGNRDFATANNGAGNNVTVVLGRGDGTFKSRQNFASGGEGPFELEVRDYNLDGIRDIAVANQFTKTGGGEGNNQGNVGVLTGRNDGTFRKARVFDAGDGPSGLADGDFNRDNKPDLVTANFGAGGPESETDTVSILRNETGSSVSQQTLQRQLQERASDD